MVSNHQLHTEGHRHQVAHPSTGTLLQIQSTHLKLQVCIGPLHLPISRGEPPAAQKVESIKLLGGAVVHGRTQILREKVDEPTQQGQITPGQLLLARQQLRKRHRILILELEKEFSMEEHPPSSEIQVRFS